MGKTSEPYPINDWVENTVRPDGIGGTTWDVYDEYAQFTGQIDYGCRFENGNCQGCDDSWVHMDHGCCSDCAKVFGYNMAIRPGSEQTYIDAWDDKDGFWGPDGCKLPRNCRSLTCLGYRCKELEYNDSDEEKVFWENLRRFVRTGKPVGLIQIETPVSV